MNLNTLQLLYTPWMDMKPHHVGVYAVISPKVGFALWDGLVWHSSGKTPTEAANNPNISDVQERYWAGISEEAYKMLRGDAVAPDFQIGWDRLMSVELQTAAQELDTYIESVTPEGIKPFRARIGCFDLRDVKAVL